MLAYMCAVLAHAYALYSRPLGSYFFTLVENVLIMSVELDDIVGLQERAQYHDDVFLVGDSPAVAEAFRKLGSVEHSHGARLKPGKSMWFGAAPPDDVRGLVTYAPTLNTVVLGIPVGTVKSRVHAAVRSLRRLLVDDPTRSRSREFRG